jgi:hypothetical protein
MAESSVKHWDVVTHNYIMGNFVVLGRVVYTGVRFMAADILNRRELGSFPTLEEAKAAVEKAFEGFEPEGPAAGGGVGQ